MKAKLQCFFDFVRSKRPGNMTTKKEILAATRWAPSTFSTYLRKHNLDPFLLALPDGNYRILKDGSTISERDITDAFTQVRPEQLVLTDGMTLRGQRETYELKAFIGNGAVAHVWRCVIEGSDSKCAAKIMNPRPDLLEPTNIENVRKRFLREAKNGQSLSHSNIVRYRDYGEVDGHPFLIMDLADLSLAKILQTGPLSQEKSVSVIKSSLDALDHLHKVGCVHRDVKPANILQFGSQFVLGDLGIVSWPDLNPAFTSAGTITRNSIQLGSWYYMAPEQRRAPHSATALSDVYALGVSWYEMLTQTTPDPADVAAKDFPPACTDTVVDQLIRRMLAFSPSARPTIQELVEYLRKIEVNRVFPSLEKPTIVQGLQSNSADPQ